MPTIKRIILLIASVVGSGQALADDWVSPCTRTMYSDTREHCVRVEPGASWGDTVGFSGQPTGAYAQATFYWQSFGATYHVIARVALLNPIAPVDCLVTRKGQLITLDNWHNCGYGVVVAFYAPTGTLIKAYRLADLFDKHEIRRFEESVSSIWWRDTCGYSDAEQTTFFIKTRKGRELYFDINSGRVLLNTAALPIAPVWAGHPVEFDLLTRDGRQYVAFYDSNRWMCVAARALASNAWDIVQLPTQLGWDSHNYVTLALDKQGCLHVSGNMHNVPLVYFRSTRPHDIHSLVPVQRMTGSNETSCTQPQYLVNASNDLLFSFRDGHSGNAAQYVNIYDDTTRTWRRLTDKPFLSGEGVRSAYPYGPVLGPDGWFHLAWVWRDTPDCATCHDLSYARSRDLLAWENIAGTPVAVPLTYSAATIVDPVPARAGLLNNIALSFDAQRRPIIAYHKNDADGFTRLHYARGDTGGWRIVAGPAWRHRWRFGGIGCIVEDIKFRAVESGLPPTLLQWYKHARYGEGILVLNADTCVATGMLAGTLRPPALEQVQSAFPGMLVKWRQGKGDQPNAGARYWLRWETLPENRDAARNGPLPPPAMLRVYTLPTLAAQHLPLRPVPTFACTEPSASNVLRNSTLADGLTGWLPWNKAREYPQAITRVVARGVPGAAHAVRIENPWRALVGVQQLVPVVSGATYRLSAWARSCATNDAHALFGGRVALYLPPQPEQQLVWMGECTQWTPQEKEFVNVVDGRACVYVHMGYGGVCSTGEFADVRLERLEPLADGS